MSPYHNARDAWRIEPLRLRLAATADAVEITRVINAAFKNAESFFIERDRIDPAKVREFLETGQFLLLEDVGGIAACIYVEKRGERAYAGLLAVAPSRQRCGLGSRLMTAAEEHCRESGCRFMDLRIVNLRSELPEFYRRRGYLQTGTAPFTPGVPTRLPCHFINMSKSLTRDDPEVKNL
jgi:GNAT superfamily N-acetyltransferase